MPSLRLSLEGEGSVRSLCAGLVLAVCCLVPSRIEAQRTVVRVEGKISASRGNFAGQLMDDSRFGVDVADLGDFDGDGVGDVVVGAHRDSSAGPERGAVWLLFLNSDGSVKGSNKIGSGLGGFTGVLDDNDRFGISVESLGDLDGNGVTDLAVGAYRDDDGGVNAGAVWILFLQADGAVIGHTKISDGSGGLTARLAANVSFGWSLTSLGDLDGDGVTDLAVGASRDDDGGPDASFDAGAEYVLFLNTDGTVKAEQKISATKGGFPLPLQEKDRFGSDAVPLGDLDGDGVTELAVGAFAEDVTRPGSVWVLFLTTAGTVKDAVEIRSGLGGFQGAVAPTDRFAASLDAADFDGNGVMDLLVGAPADDDGGQDRGAVWLLFLGPDGTVLSYDKISNQVGGLGGPLANQDEFGAGCAAIGDLDGDGALDLAVGAYLDDDGGPDRGALWVLLLGGDLQVPAVDFVADVTSGLAPLNVSFTNHSTGTATSWHWDFGDGVTATVSEPLHTFAAPGTYDVTLTATGPFGSDSLTRVGLVQALETPQPPVAAFSGMPLSGFPPLRVFFADASTGEPDSWIWNFGDGSASTLASPEHVYPVVGTYDVGLTVTSPNGSDQLVRPQLVIVEEPEPRAFFTVDVTTGEAPLTVTFTDDSRLNVTGWLWLFGDGQSSTEQHPVHVYQNPGTYSPGVQARSAGGADTHGIANLIRVTVPVQEARFTADPVMGNPPLTVTFQDRSTLPATSWAWDFGDGTTSTLQNPTHVYGAIGTHTVTLTIDGPQGPDAVVKLDHVRVVVPAPTANFAAGPLFGSSPHTVSFSDQSSADTTAWAWSFGDGGTSSLPSPSHTYTSQGTFVPTLTVSGAGGNDTFVGAPVVVQNPPVPGFQPSVPFGQAPLEVEFFDTTGGSVTSWFWSFGDGGTSSLSAPVHTFTTPGTYSVSLTVSNGAGAQTLNRPDLIVVSEAPPIAGFTASATVGQPPFDVIFTDTSSGSVTTRQWRFGDGTTSSLANPVHTFANAGTFDVTLTARGPGGADTTSPLSIASMQPPNAGFIGGPAAGLAPHSVFFTDVSTGNVTSWAWDFGDGATSSLEDPTHVYVSAGTYTVQLVAGNPVGTDTHAIVDVIQVTDPAPRADFLPSGELGLTPFSVIFDNRSIGPVSAWAWDFGDGSASTASDPVHVYTTPGTFVPSLTATGPGGQDTFVAANPIVVQSTALSAFTSDVRTGVVPLTVSFSELSAGTVTSYLWQFGDGETSTAADPTHVYAQPGRYQVSLMVGNLLGTDTRSQVDWIVAQDPLPLPSFTHLPGTGQAPLTVAFTDTSQGLVTGWSWDFGDGGTSSLASPTHVFSDPGTYSVGLTARNATGAVTDLRGDLIVVIEPPPVAAFVIAPESGPAPLSVSFEDTSSGLVTSWSWDFGDGTASNLAAPTHVYTGVGLYDVSLTVGNPTGTDTVLRPGLVEVLEPVPVPALAAMPTVGIAPLAVTFTDASQGSITHWSWAFGDGATSSLANPTHVYVDPGTYDVALTVGNTTGEATALRTGLVVVLDPPPATDFTLEPSTGIAPLTVTFQDLSSGVVTAWEWDFGDGAGASVPNPTHTYTTPGTYSVALISANATGADVRSLPDAVVVLEPPPLAEFAATPSSGIAPLAVSFEDRSTGLVTSWSWDFGDGAQSSAPNPTHVYAAPGDYSVNLTVANASGADSRTLADVVQVGPALPVALAGATPRFGPAPLSVTFEDLSSGVVTSWLWDFGDGLQSTLAQPVHVYTSTGTYTVSLTVSNATGSHSDLRPAFVVVADPPPVAGFVLSPSAGRVPLSVTFSDASTGVVTSWAWDFGDGAVSSQPSQVHEYTAPGTYTVSLTAANPSGADTRTVVGAVVVDPLPPPPVPNWSATPLVGVAPLTTHFRDLSTGEVTAWSWDFGDGGASTFKDPSHRYDQPGVYAVTLTASGPGGASVLTRPDYVVVHPPAPQPLFTATPSLGLAPLSVQFSTQTSGPVSASTWDFGDGAVSNSSAPIHVYTDPGTYSVTLTQSNAGGEGATTRSGLVVVLDPPPVADFEAAPTTGEAPLTVAFTDRSTGLVTEGLWVFGDGQVSTVRNPVHTYTTPGTYTVSLLLANPQGNDVESRPGLIVVTAPAPVAALSATPSGGRVPLDVQFTDRSTGSVTSWFWDFGDGRTSSLPAPRHTYTLPGLFKVRLTVTGPGGSSSATIAPALLVRQSDLEDQQAGSPPASGGSITPTRGVQKPAAVEAPSGVRKAEVPPVSSPAIDRP